ncbi:serine hydrolase domain-containing protein [Micromonospora auratinigra]|uniref:CubicO group peptidase, beta-lactamase class C family n=1 Tax=Micromonospora auratinigra TaxID=261654 RepID=A0A1A8ZJD8_9ACTN|nr:serine hydrolase domain-containing protein [Micromonospora auratinigra]SBT44008.1 CubicO group peptidase, beta-lactamase class C family [Micromonospora auratinigra]
MDGTTIDRRTFGKLVGATGVGTLGAAALGPAPANAALPIWATSGIAVSSLSAFDDTMKDFMQARHISAGQLAVTYQGRLVLARGYGNNSPQAVRPTTLFRVASLSKSLTAAAIVRLAQDGRLNLGDPITRFLDVIPPGGQTVDPRLSQVTLWRLLQHTGGWDKDLTNFDPVFRDRVIADALGVPMELSHADVIRFMSGQPLLHDPGSTVSYSNYGYLLAGRIIEKVTGLPYETYVQQALLAPRGITRMATGSTTTRHSGEVAYASQYTGPTVLDDSGTIVNAPYGTFSMRIHDANGGWLSSAVDLVRWAATFDSGNTVLNSTSINRVFSVPNPTGVNADGWYYGLGWAVRPVSGGTGRNTWHTGSFAGTYSIMVRTYQGMSWAAVFNRRDDSSGLSYDTIDSALWAASRAVTSWPTHDLWSNYFG